MSKTSKGIAVITGASSGIGAIYADRLAKRGYDLILVARNRDKLEAVANHIHSATNRSVRTVAADLGDKTDLERIETLLATEPGISMLVNNAGVGAVAPLLEADPDAMERIIDLNVTALTRLTYAAAPALVARGGGTIINIASIVAIRPESLNGVYGASKAFVLALSQSLHKELADRNIRVQAVLPGATATDFWEISGRPLDALPTSIVMSAADMVDAALAGLDQGELVTIPALPNAADWSAYEAARRNLFPNLSNSRAAERFRIAAAA